MGLFFYLKEHGYFYLCLDALVWSLIFACTVKYSAFIQLARKDEPRLWVLMMMERDLLCIGENE